MTTWRHVNAYIVLHSILNLDQTCCFYSSRTRGHTFNGKANSFSQRVIYSWHHLLTDFVTASNLSVFKTKFDTFYKNIKFDLLVYSSLGSGLQAQCLIYVLPIFILQVCMESANSGRLSCAYRKNTQKKMRIIIRP